MADFSRVYQRYLQATRELIPDEQVGYLPWPEKKLPGKTALWHERGQSYLRVADRIRATQGQLRILDLGCGNGWMAGRLSLSKNVEVWGVDIADFQIQQAERVFGGKENLHFLTADIFDDPLPNSQFDIIVVADTAQFFSNIGLLISQLQEMLSHKGKIFLTGNAFCLLDEIEEVKRRKWAKFDELGLPQMRELYHFHSVEEMTVLGAECLLDAQPQAGGLLNMVQRGKRSQHYWWSIGGG